jgi:hypothetical protein
MCAKRREARNFEKVPRGGAIFGPKQKYGLADSIGRRCMKILKDMLHHAPNAKEPETSLKEILCP